MEDPAAMAFAAVVVVDPYLRRHLAANVTAPLFAFAGGALCVVRTRSMYAAKARPHSSLRRDPPRRSDIDLRRRLAPLPPTIAPLRPRLYYALAIVSSWPTPSSGAASTSPSGVVKFWSSSRGEEPQTAATMSSFRRRG
jgi:hypothetical protein